MRRKRIVVVLIYFIGYISSVAQSYEISKDSVNNIIVESFKIISDGEYSKAHEQLSFALEYGKRHRNDSIVGDVYNCLGSLFRSMGDFDNASKYYALSKKALIKANYKSYLIYHYNNVGNLYNDKKDYVNAEKNLKQARNLALELNDSFKAIWPTSNIAEIKYNLGDYENAYFYLLETIKLYEPDTIQQPDIIISTYRYLGNIYSKFGEPEKAIQNFAKAKEIALAHDSYSKLILIEKDKAILFDELNQPENAKKAMTDQIKFLEKNFENQQSLIKEQNQLERDLFEKESSLVLTRALNKSQEESLQKIKYFALALLALFFITISVVVLLYKSNKNRLNLNNSLKVKNKELLDAKEKTEYAAQLKTNFFSTISHELRTPLYAVTGITDILIDENPKKNQVHYLNALKSSGEHLLSLINNILQINRYDANKIELNVIEFNIEEIINNLKNALSYLKKENNNRIHISVDNDIPKKLKGDSIKLSQVIINLLGNALKFTENGNIWLTVNRVGVEQNRENEVTLKINIKDDGIGISKQMQSRIFEDFYQESIQLNRNYEGAGLGLAIVKRLLNAMGSEIMVDSNPNEGASFSFVIKFECEPEITQAQIIDEDLINLKDKTVLVVDDNAINQMITRRILETKNADVVVIDNGFDAIELVENQNFDIILMDIHMPKMNGYETTKKIRDFNTETPIIALTAVDLSENREKISASGMNGVISKPFQLDHFYIELNRFIS
ncbi:response regulator [Aquimarina sp. 2201CG1-2-11]|uniref:tetratricopeptide repeat-containing hybrid sensor histidine kinase/response regulator n=1 Tax=Aquimarina discodermiae TaxID=3231043 RepID=UPI0034621275